MSPSSKVNSGNGHHGRLDEYLFNTRGWLMLPGVLAPHDIDSLREFALRLQLEPEAHPEQRGALSPHNGSGMFRFAYDSHHYQCIPGKAFSGLTRAVWELTPVRKGTGGTLLATGSHKAACAAPESTQDPDSAVWETYECPAGSVLFFTEALAHSTAPWTNEDNPRVSVFNLYNSVGSRWGSWNPPDELLREMPPMRQTLFRGTHCAGNLPGYRYGGQNQEGRCRHSSPAAVRVSELLT